MLLSKDFYQLTGLAGGIFALKEDKNKPEAQRRRLASSTLIL